AVGIEVRAGREVHREAMGEPLAAMLGSGVLAPVKIDEPRDRADAGGQRRAAGLDLLGGSARAQLQDQDVAGPWREYRGIEGGDPWTNSQIERPSSRPRGWCSRAIDTRISVTASPCGPTPT